MPGLGLAGAHRTGKTTLAKLYSERRSVAYATISASEVIAEKGWQCADIRNIDVRLDVQEALIQRCWEVFGSHRELFVSDRTPLDVAAYMLADVSQEDIGKDREDRVEEIVHCALDCTNSCFGAIMLMPPVLPYVPAQGKPRDNRAYQLHVQTLIEGLAQGLACEVPRYFLKPEDTNLDHRCQILHWVYGNMVENDTHIAQAVMQH